MKAVGSKLRGSWSGMVKLIEEEEEKRILSQLVIQIRDLEFWSCWVFFPQAWPGQESESCSV